MIFHAKTISALILLCHSLLHAQDPAGFLFRQQGALYNPALAGSSGSQAVSVVYRNQWYAADATAAYQTAVLSYEESLPCSILDYGIQALWDQEGDGLLSTYELTPRISANLPLISTKDHQINMRLGGGMSIGWQRIDFAHLIFSDQLHPKYGNIFPTHFTPPDEANSSAYFQPGVGMAMQMVLNKLSANAVVVNAGASFHNIYRFGAGDAGYGKSILGLFPPQSPRFMTHLDFELVPGSSFNQFVSIRPMIMYEKQEALQYFQYGVDVGLHDALRIGGYVHQQGFRNTQTHTNWISATALFRPYLGNSRIDLHLTYSFNSSGLKNAVSPLLELGIKKHFRNSPVCRLMGRGDDVDYGNKPVCRYSRISPAKKKLYENIWYRD